MSIPARVLLLCVVSALVSATLLRVSSSGAVGVLAPQTMPEFTQRDASEWLNSVPLTRSELRGEVVLIEVWTYGCINCQRSIPWLRELVQRNSGTPLRLIGIHTPEFSDEHDRSNVETHLRQFGVTWPVMLDNDQAYWDALNNQYWPALYLVDKQGRIRAASVGEVHAGDAQAQRIETQIASLLKE